MSGFAVYKKGFHETLFCTNCGREVGAFLKPIAYECQQCHKVFCAACRQNHVDVCPAGASAFEKLKKLAELRQMDIITEEEYHEKRKKLMEMI